MSDSTSLININYSSWFQCFRSITNTTNERTIITDNVSYSGLGNSSPFIDYNKARAVASLLVLANMNSLPLDWAARFSVGGTNMNFFIVKQFPVLAPETYLEETSSGFKYAELIVPRSLELIYTAHDLDSFARDLGYTGGPFSWNDQRRHCLRCELDAIFAHMYQLDRSEIEWILDPPAPSFSFSVLKNNETKEFGEYRTQRYVLYGYDQLSNGEVPNLENISK